LIFDSFGGGLVVRYRIGINGLSVLFDSLVDFAVSLTPPGERSFALAVELIASGCRGCENSGL